MNCFLKDYTNCSKLKHEIIHLNIVKKLIFFISLIEFFKFFLVEETITKKDISNIIIIINKR